MTKENHSYELWRAIRRTCIRAGLSTERAESIANNYSAAVEKKLVTLRSVVQKFLDIAAKN